MNVNVVAEFQKIISRSFNFKNKVIYCEDFDSEWTKVEVQYQHLLLPDEKGLLKDIHSELRDIIVHMPGEVKNPKVIDWVQWMDDDEYLKFLISREALCFSLNRLDFQKALKASIGSGVFRRPYKDSEAFRLEICRFLKGFVSSSS